MFVFRHMLLMLSICYLNVTHVAHMLLICYSYVTLICYSCYLYVTHMFTHMFIFTHVTHMCFICYSCYSYALVAHMFLLLLLLCGIFLIWIRVLTPWLIIRLNQFMRLIWILCELVEVMHSPPFWCLQAGFPLVEVFHFTFSEGKKNFSIVCVKNLR